MTSTNREYIATKSFFAGEINLKINEQERIRFDGFKAMIRGQEYKCSTLMAAIRAGLLTLAQTDATGKQIEQMEPVKESAEQRAKRLKEERLRAINGAKGNGEILEEITVKPTKVVKRDGTPVMAQATTEVSEKPKKKEKRAIIQENEGKEVAKVSKPEAGIEDDTSKSFYEALLDGEKKKLEIAKDQFAAKKVIKKDNQDDAVEVKKLVESVGDASEITPKKDPMKSWKSMTVKKKEAFIKKQTDISLIKRIIDSEGGTIRRKAEERLAEVDHAKDVGQHP
jgi:hypothetical protein